MMLTIESIPPRAQTRGLDARALICEAPGLRPGQSSSCVARAK